MLDGVAFSTEWDGIISQPLHLVVMLTISSAIALRHQRLHSIFLQFLSNISYRGMCEYYTSKEDVWYHTLNQLYAGQSKGHNLFSKYPL